MKKLRLTAEYYKTSSTIKGELYLLDTKTNLYRFQLIMNGVLYLKAGDDIIYQLVFDGKWGTSKGCLEYCFSNLEGISSVMKVFAEVSLEKEKLSVEVVPVLVVEEEILHENKGTNDWEDAPDSGEQQ